MKNLSRVSLLLATGFLFSCAAAPQAPTFAKKGQGDSRGTGGDTPTSNVDGGGSGGPIESDPLSVALYKEFDGFVKGVDELELKSVENAGKVPALIVQSQLALSEIYASSKKEEPADGKGRCLLFASNDKVFTDKELNSKELVLSPAGKIVYSKSAALTSDDCQKLFKEKLADRYKADFFNLHEVFYGGLK